MVFHGRNTQKTANGGQPPLQLRSRKTDHKGRKPLRSRSERTGAPKGGKEVPAVGHLPSHRLREGGESAGCDLIPTSTEEPAPGTMVGPTGPRTHLLRGRGPGLRWSNPGITSHPRRAPLAAPYEPLPTQASHRFLPPCADPGQHQPSLFKWPDSSTPWSLSQPTGGGKTPGRTTTLILTERSG